MRSHAKASVAVLVAILALAVGAALASAVAPTVTIDAPTGVDGNQAHLSGHVKAEDANVSTCRFEYVTDADYLADQGGGGSGFGSASSAECDVFPEAGNESDVQVDLSVLSGGTLYHVRLVADNGESSSSGEQTFTTDPIATPAASIDPPSGVAFTIAHLEGTVDPGGSDDDAFDAACRFEYVTDADYLADQGGGGSGFGSASSTDCNTNPVPNGSGATSVEADLSGLNPGTLYHVRLLATNAGGSTPSSEETLTTEGVSAPVVTITAPADVDERSAHLSGTVDPGGTDPAFDVSALFEYATQADFSDVKFAAGGEVSGVGAQLVAADIGCLEPNETYFVRLRATNKGGPVFSDVVQFTTNPLAPEVGANASSANEKKGILAGWVNPHNSSTDYHFEWGSQGDCESSPCQSTPVQNLDDGNNPVHVHANITGLTANATYHYRLVAESVAGTAEGADRTLIASSALPDDRAYELVSPADKNGGNVLVDSGRTRTATDGSAIQFASVGGFGDVHGGSIATEYLSERGPDGWSTHGITPLLSPQDAMKLLGAGLEPRYIGEFSDDLDRGVMMSNRLLTAPEGGNAAALPNLFVRDNLRSPGAGSYALASDAFAPVSLPSVSYKPTLAGASDDFSHILFSSTANLTEDAPPQGLFCLLGLGGCQPRVYEWVEGSGVRLVSVLPDEECTALGEAPGCPAKDFSIAGAAVEPNRYSPGTISRDGSRLFFTVGSGSAQGDLYMREDGETTLRMNKSERTDCAGDPTCGGDDTPDPSPDAHQTARFWDAAEDGSVAYFTTAERLVDGDGNGFIDLYRWQRTAPEGSRLTLVSVDSELADGAEAVDAVLGASANGEYVYFLGFSQMVAGGPPAPPGSHYLLFAWHDGVVSFVDPIDFGDGPQNSPLNAWNLVHLRSRISSDGKHSLYISRDPENAVGYDSGFCQNGPCSELFVYSVGEGSEGTVACASCRPDGTAAKGNADVMFRREYGATASGASLPRALSDKGRRVFFSTEERLVPEDQNGRVEDTYAYDIPSGQVHLLSSGTSSSPSLFVGASANGADVFFTTRDQLVGWDVDNSIDIYDAKVGGGLPEPPSPPPSCQGDACQPAPTVLSDATPASSGFAGPGNPNARKAKARKCPQGKRRIKARGKTRCIKKSRANTNRRASK